MNSHIKKNTLTACDYSTSYATIYDSSYGAGFIFVDTEDSISDCENNYLPISSFSTFSKRKQRRNILQIIIAKA